MPNNLSEQKKQFIDIRDEKSNLWKYLQKSSKLFENNLDPHMKRMTGSYYTGIDLAYSMIEEIFNYMGPEFIKELPRKSFLEPCVGTGNFVFAYLRKVSEINYANDEIKKIIDNIYVCDICSEALTHYKNSFLQFIKIFFDISVDGEYFNKHVTGGLLFNVEAIEPEYLPIAKYFPEIITSGGFDIVVTNPPYKNLKAEKGQYKSGVLYEADKEKYAFIKKMAGQYFNYSNGGVLNLYKLFVEEIVNRYSKNNAIISLLIPATILTDKTTEGLRTLMIEKGAIKSVKMISENNPYIDAQQSLCTVLLEKGGKTDYIDINKDYTKNPNHINRVFLNDMVNNGFGNEIFALDEKGYDTLKKMYKHPALRDLDFIINMRGELDLTANKNSITDIVTDYKLIRGKNIGYYKLNMNDPSEYVENEFVEQCSKRKYIHEDRIACQQVVNLHKKRRVTFSYVNKKHVLGNSCNYISALNNKYWLDLYFLLGLFNTPLINWYFKLASSNNHVNNYEIDRFPIPLDIYSIKNVSDLVKKYLKTYDEKLLQTIESIVNNMYGIESSYSINDAQVGNFDNIMMPTIYNYHADLSSILPTLKMDDASKVLSNKTDIDVSFRESEVELGLHEKEVCRLITEKYRKISQNQVLNHTTFKLSDLDMEMVKAVPPGGNWKNIPQETVIKSKRLIRIAETGGRTTLYGRIDYDKPSYTITTYFSRPGNGTYIHPEHDRVLSVREAARLQSFKDDYYFVGNKSDLLAQVGNAVPPILAYRLGKKIFDITSYNKSIDLFCGAGGLSVGFKEAGINAILATDINKSACLTYKINNPEIDTLIADITDANSKDYIIRKAIENEVEIIAGGPPCQGFSHAGKRFLDDPRNELFKHFIEIVEVSRPKVVVIENVEGMLTFKKGEIYRYILELFYSMGYISEGRLLMASDYGVPQKRKRVIIISIDEKMKIDPCLLFPNEVTPELYQQLTARDAIYDLQKIDCGDPVFYKAEDNIDSDYVKYMKSKITISQYLKENMKPKDEYFQMRII